MAQAARKQVAHALVPLERALILAEPEGYLRIFVDEGEAMQEILHRLATKGGARSYAQRLLGAFEPVPPVTVSSHVPATTLVEPLTARQIEILRLIAAGLRNQEIADQLFLSLPTVKRHIANVYGRLGVDHRTEAIARANELKLL